MTTRAWYRLSLRQQLIECRQRTKRWPDLIRMTPHQAATMGLRDGERFAAKDEESGEAVLVPVEVCAYGSVPC